MNIKSLHTKTWVLGAVFASALSISASADLTRHGAVGLPLNPTAQTPGGLGVSVQANYFNGGDAKVSGLYAAGRVGALEISGGLEGVNGSGVFEPLDDTSVAIGAKYVLTRALPVPNPTGVQFAVGAGYSEAQFRNAHVYAVGSATVPFLGVGGNSSRVHLGARYDSFDADVPLLDGQDKGSVFAGLEVPLTRDGRLHFIGELATKNSNNERSEAPYSAGVRYRQSGFSGTLGVLRDGFTGESGLYAQLGRSF